MDPRNDLPDVVDALFNGTPAERKAVVAVLYAEDAVLWNSMYTCAPTRAVLGASAHWGRTRRGQQIMALLFSTTPCIRPVAC